MTDVQPTRRRLASLGIRIGGAWILLGGLLKLFLGTPADLPAPVRNFLPNADLTFWGAIAVETGVGLLSILHPRLAWPFLSAVLLLFVAILSKLIAAGAESCGCFGPSITFPPALMLAIDGVCLVEILVSRPWRSLAPGRRPLALPASALLAIAAPWAVLGPPPVRAPQSGRTGREGENPASRPIPRWVTFEPKEWIGKPIAETNLADWMDVGKAPGDAAWILYRINCPHCAAHFRRIKLEQDRTQDYSTMYVIVRLPEENDERERVIDPSFLPANLIEVELPRVTRYLLETPWELALAGGVVRSATQHRDGS